MAKKLWLNESESITIGKSTPIVLDEFASRERSVDFTLMGSYLPNPDPILKAAGIDQTVYRDILTDAHAGAVVGSRKAGIKAMQWEIEPNGAPAAQHQFVVDVFANLKVARMIYQMLDAPLFGYQPMEVMWRAMGAYSIPYHVEGKPQEWFVFGDKNQLLFRSRDNWNGDPVPDRKILLPRHEDTYQNPYGFPLLSRCFYYWMFKKGGVKFWVRYSERFGMPFTVGKLPGGRSEDERRTLLNGLKKMIQDACAVINDDESIEFLEADGKSSSTDTFERLCMYCDAQISKAIVGQTLTTEIGKTGGANAAAETHNEVRAEIVDGDKEIVETQVNELIRWICEVNFAGAGPLPLFKLFRPEDLERKAKRDKGIYDLGVRFEKEYFEEEYNLDPKHFTLLPSAPAGAASALGAPAPTGVPAPARLPRASAKDAAFAAPAGRVLSPHTLHLHFAAPERERFPDQTALDTALNALPADKLQGFAEGLLKPVWPLIETGGTAEEMAAALAGAYAEMDDAELQETLTQALFVSEVWGRLNAKE